MASIRREFCLRASPERVWDALRDFGALHTRLVRGFVTDTRVEAGDRLVTFANGMVARERIIDIDDETRRIAWAATGSPRLAHHNASVQVYGRDGCTQAVWIVDVLPDDAAPGVALMVDHAIAAMQRTFAEGDCGDQPS
jgi:carbon monoxide dehydrogenase subunit G